MANKFLDSNGVLYLWNKVKAIMPKKTSELTNDSGFITADEVPETVFPSSTAPKMNGTASVGTETTFARGDHVHPSDTTKVDKVAGKGLSTEDFTTALKTKLEGIAEGATKVEGSTNGKIKINGIDTTVYMHPTGDGNNHLPSGGTVGQVLRANGSGVGIWGENVRSGVSAPADLAAGELFVKIVE